MPASTSTPTSRAEASTSNSAAIAWSAEARWLHYLVLTWLGFGLLVLTSASLPLSQYLYGDGLYLVKRQLVFVAVGLGCFAFIARYPMQRWLKLGGLLYLLALALVLATHIPGLGETRNAAKRWLDLGIAVQPAEFLKPVLVLQASVVLGRWYRSPAWYRAVWIVLFAIGLGAVLAQPDLGTTAICGVTVWLMAVVAGLSFATLWKALVLGLGAATLSILTKRYQLDRIKGLLAYLLNGTDAAREESYQLIQSLQAIGSGGLWGEGFGLSRQKLFYLPIQHTDFIFSVYAEELGLIGTLGFLALLAVFSAIALRVAARCRDIRLRLVAYGCLSLLVGQALLNIGVASGLLPTTGITLPLFSYGGSSILASAIAAGFLVRVARECNRSKPILLAGGDRPSESKPEPHPDRQIPASD
ncbi:FtsW/RodA/SpoVE family cell cycle protein [Synechococcus sp. PCC 7336]|uniref:FtsW/RodA/SpoVE family cell cycle protein n=1 Tax=Synechococcus sp. PCC 7336 TaxID=195250 RepID=UPI00037464E2|nr:putative peptidoglycan glycosyltransferase FtsW [Synechococcus sp. PCC 7336]